MHSLSTLVYTVFIVLAVFQCVLGCKDEPVTDDLAGSSVRIEVHPESINELITEEINITCRPQDLPQNTEDILFMELGKDGEHPLAALRGPTLKLGTHMKNNMQVKGHIAKNISQSYLQLTIKRPFVDDVNVYCCRIFYQNEFGELKMGQEYADVSLENNEKTVLTYLLKKVQDMEEYTKDLEIKLLKQQQKYTTDLEKTIKDKQMDQAITMVLSRIDQLETAANSTNHVMQEMADRDSFTSAFSVFGTRNKFNVGETFTFNEFLLNIGNSYDLETGVFTAPKKGLYVFHLSVFVPKTSSLFVYLKVNDAAIKASLHTEDKDTYDQSSVSTVLSLNAADRVSIYVANGGSLAGLNEHYSVFNGYLLKLL